jgi:hypothetical protein
MSRESVPDCVPARVERVWGCDEEEGAEAARERMGAAAAVEKNALVLRALLSALRERRCTPRCVSMVDDVDDDEVGERTDAGLPAYKVGFHSPTPASSDRTTDRPGVFSARASHITRSAQPQVAKKKSQFLGL